MPNDVNGFERLLHGLSPDLYIPPMTRTQVLDRIVDGVLRSYAAHRSLRDVIVAGNVMKDALAVDAFYAQVRGDDDVDLPQVVVKAGWLRSLGFGERSISSDELVYRAVADTIVTLTCHELDHKAYRLVAHCVDQKVEALKRAVGVLDVGDRRIGMLSGFVQAITPFRDVDFSSSEPTDVVSRREQCERLRTNAFKPLESYKSLMGDFTLPKSYSLP